MIAKIAVSAAPFAIDKPYSYSIPQGMKPVAGIRVTVPFGRGNRKTEGVVLEVTEGSAEGLKTIDACLDQEPLLSQQMLHLAAFMRERYFCSFYDCLRAMLPGALWFRTKITYHLTPDRSWQEKSCRRADALAMLNLLQELGGQAQESALRPLAEDEEAFQSAMAYLAGKKWIHWETDYLQNVGDKTEPYMILYHCNMGYPLLSENSIVKIPHNDIVARSEAAEKNIDTALKMEKPQTQFEERCYFFDMKESGGIVKTGIFNPEIEKGVVFSYNKEQLPYLTEWKMMGKTDYALGLEPGNCQPGERTFLKKNGIVKYLEPEQKGTTALKFTFVDKQSSFEKSF